MFVRMSVTIREDQKKWLEEHPSISASGLLREAIDRMIKIMSIEEERT